MNLKETIRPLTDAATAEVDHWRRELERPWREGGTEPAARVGRWIGVGLAVGATVLGAIVALRAERPWE